MRTDDYVSTQLQAVINAMQNNMENCSSIKRSERTKNVTLMQA